MCDSEPVIISPSRPGARSINQSTREEEEAGAPPSLRSVGHRTASQRNAGTRPVLDDGEEDGDGGAPAAPPAPSAPPTAARAPSVFLGEAGAEEVEWPLLDHLRSGVTKGSLIPGLLGHNGAPKLGRDSPNSDDVLTESQLLVSLPPVRGAYAKLSSPRAHSLLGGPGL